MHYVNGYYAQLYIMKRQWFFQINNSTNVNKTNNHLSPHWPREWSLCRPMEFWPRAWSLYMPMEFWPREWSLYRPMEFQ
jgi:hypothetical protein